MEKDAGALNEMAQAAGIPAEEMSVEIHEFRDEVREEFEQLQSEIDNLTSSLNASLDEIKQLIVASAARPRNSSGASGD
eukprot:4405775-Prymnesium_polylepis.1